MTADELIAEGRRLQRPSAFLRAQGNGPVAAIWHGDDDRSADERRWLTIDCSQFPTLSLPASGFLQVYTDERATSGGRIELVSAWPELEASDTQLYATPAFVLPPLAAVFAKGSDRIEEWLAANGWERRDPPNDNFPDRAVTDRYEAVFMSEFPLYLSNTDIHAIVGGWHMPFPDGDWYDLIDQRLVAFTLRDCEPWVEAWQNAQGEFHIIQRIT